jgi:vacuolar-type H+-ATPase subunit D/Vma8
MPAGRAGRRWLAGRLATAEQAAELLDGKLRVLRRTQRSYHLRAERTAAAWSRACSEAETWLLRARLLGGQQALRDASPDGAAIVELRWTVVMGVQHPVDAFVTPGAIPAGAVTPSNTALVHAVAAYRALLDAAAQHAVVTTTVRRVDAEVVATQRRLRAIRDRRIPVLRQALVDLELELEELEHADAVRLHRAAASSTARWEER